MNKVILVAKREYLKVVRSVTFWVATLFFPVFLGVVMLISGLSESAMENKAQDTVKNAKQVLILDDSTLISASLIKEPLVTVTNKDEAITKVKENKADAFIYVPKDVLTVKNVETYVTDKGIFLDGSFDSVGGELIKESLLLRVGDQSLIAAINSPVSSKTTVFKDGRVLKIGAETFIVPIATFVIYILLVSLSTSYLLMSVAEEKENRVIETVLSYMKPRELIYGKIIGISLIMATQVMVLLSTAVVAFKSLESKLPFAIDFSTLTISPWQIVLAVFYLICGFLIIANIMVGTGSIAPSYKEASSLSAPFILLSIFPVYFLSYIFTEPNGTISLLVSYFPLTSALVLLIRNALGSISLVESIISPVVLVIYVYGSFVLAYKLFELGALEYSQKVSMKSVLGVFRKKK